MPYVLSHGTSPHGTDWLFESAAECYLPLLDVLARLRNASIYPRWTINITPILAEQLSDESFKSGFEAYCEAKIQIARADQERFARDGQLWTQGLAAWWQRFYTRALVQFKHVWGRDLTGAFRFFQDEGSIEIVTCAATHGYLPLLGTDESVRAQIQLGVQTHRRHFRKEPRGIWLPECAYRPAYDWKPPVGQSRDAFPRQGIETFLAEQGIEYFFVDSHMIRGGEPLGTYAANFPQLAELFARSKKMFTPPAEARSEYEHYALPNGLTCFARDPHTTVRVWSGEVGYPGDPRFLEFHKQLYPGRLRYWAIGTNKADLGAKPPYSPWDAYDQLAGQAADFVQLVTSTLARYRGQTDRTGTLVAMYDTELFGHWWFEGPEFLYEVAVRMHQDPALEMVSGSDVLEEEPPRHTIHLPEGSWGEGGYHYIWLNADNAWTWERLYPAEERMRYMARHYANGPAHAIVLQCARELLLAEASDWQFLISTWAARDYAEVRFSDHIGRFERLASLADRVHRGAALTPDDEEFLAECRRRDAAFAELDLNLWRGTAAHHSPTKQL